MHRHIIFYFYFFPWQIYWHSLFRQLMVHSYCTYPLFIMFFDIVVKKRGKKLYCLIWHCLLYFRRRKVIFDTSIWDSDSLIFFFFFFLFFCPTAIFFQAILCFYYKSRLCDIATRFYHGKESNARMLSCIYSVCPLVNPNPYFYVRPIAEEVRSLIFTNTWYVPLKMISSELLVLGKCFFNHLWLLFAVHIYRIYCIEH